MSVPENPETVVIKNEYYQAGLNESKVWNHYQKYKANIIKEINSRPVMLWIFIDLNRSIVKRKVFNTPFTITNTNYDKIISGRTVSISTELPTMTNVAIVDIDPGPTTTEQHMKDAIIRLLNSSFGTSSSVIGNRIISTANGYHVYFLLSKKININVLRRIILKMLHIDFGNDYLINEKNPKGSNINMDITPTTYRGGHQIPFALCRNGLMAMDITNYFGTFNRRSAII